MSTSQTEFYVLSTESCITARFNLQHTPVGGFLVFVNGREVTEQTKLEDDVLTLNVYDGIYPKDRLTIHYVYEPAMDKEVERNAV